MSKAFKKISQGLKEALEYGESNYICMDCGQDCEVTEEVFDYAGTHCTNGIGGTHRTGHYSSDCCEGEYMAKDEFDMLDELTQEDHKKEWSH